MSDDLIKQLRAARKALQYDRGPAGEVVVSVEAFARMYRITTRHPEAVRLLRQVWGTLDGSTDGPVFRCCQHWASEGHSPRCEIDAFLRDEPEESDA